MSTPTWLERIDAAEARGHFTYGDVADALAWDRCACCEIDRQLCAPGGMPWDKRLDHLGVRFLRAVKLNHFSSAHVIYQAIQDRAAELLEGSRP